MNRRKLMKTTFIILLLTFSMIVGSNQAAQALNYNQDPSNQEVQQVATEPAQNEVGLQDTEDTIEIWIVQDFVITVYDLAFIECHVLSLYGIEIDVEIEVWIQYDNGSVFLIYEETRVLYPYLEYVFNVTHVFTLVGFHLANLKVMDITHQQEVTTVCYWEVIDGYFEIFIYQDYEAQVGIEIKIEIYIYNGYAIAKELYIELLIDDGTGPVQIHAETTWVAAYDVLIIIVYWTFAIGGHHDVILEVTDIVTQIVWLNFCYWEVYDGFIDIIIEQNYEAYIGVEERIQIWVYNYYAIDIETDVSVWITNGTHTFELYFNVLVTINAGTYFMDEIFYTFIYEGFWELYVEVYVSEFDITWREYCLEGWWIYGGFIDVWIYQQYEVFVSEEAIMYCWVMSNYAVDRDIAIEVWITNATHSILIYGETTDIAPGEVYNFTVYWVFLYADYWDVKIVVIDLFSGIFYVNYCYWYVYWGYFELYIYQEYYGLLEQELWMMFEIYNFFAVEKTVGVEILIFDGVNYVQLYYEIVLIDALGFYFFELWYLFAMVGYYDVILIVTELDTGLVWIEYCWWWIYAEYLDIWIVQDLEASVGEEVLMEFWIVNYYSIEMDLTVEVWISGDTDPIISDTVIIPANGIYTFTLPYTFLYAGFYTVTLIVIDNATGAQWVEYCRWSIYEGFIEVWIIQDYEAVVGQEVWMQFYAQSYYSYDVPIYVEVRIDTGYGIVILFTDSLVLLSYQLLMWNLSYIFMNPGIFHIYFVVVEVQTGNVWIAECRWYIHEDGWLDIWIEQGYYGETGVNYLMQFGVGNLYSIDKDLNLVVKIVQGADSWIAHNETKLVLSMTTYSFDVNWMFVNDGWYDVYFIVTDIVTGIVQTLDCWWKIEEAVIIPEFSAITLIPILGALSAAVYLALRRKRKLTH